MNRNSQAFSDDSSFYFVTLENGTEASVSNWNRGQIFAQKLLITPRNLVAMLFGNAHY